MTDIYAGSTMLKDGSAYNKIILFTEVCKKFAIPIHFPQALLSYGRLLSCFRFPRWQLGHRALLWHLSSNGALSSALCNRSQNSALSSGVTTVIGE
jgi:hypothetical protein